MPIDLIRQDDFPQFAADCGLARFVRIQDRVAHQLLGNRRSTSAALACQVDIRRAEGGAEVNALMFVEVDVLSGQRGLDQVRRDIVQRNNRALATRRVVDLPQQLAFAIEDLSCLEAEAIRIVQHANGGQLADHREQRDHRGNAAQNNEQQQAQQQIRNPGSTSSPRRRRRIRSLSGRSDSHL